MNSKGDGAGLPRDRRPRTTGLALIALNVLLLAAIFLMYSLYNNAYKERLREENLGNITNMNRSAAANTTALFESWDIKLDDIAGYAQLHDLNVEETLELISDSNSNSERFFELIGADHTGYLARKNADGSFPTLNYSHTSYAALHKIFDGEDSEAPDAINFSPEFTDAGETAAKFFAVYKHITLKNSEGEPETYTLLLAARSASVMERLNEQSGYVGQSTVLIDAAGDYIVSSSDYKSDNFFQFLYVYNDLTLDEKNAVRQEVSDLGSGELYYKNAGVVVEDCVFHYERMARSGWYCVTCVPLSSFRAPTFNNSYLVYLVVFLLVLFVADIIWLQRINRQLRVSVQREKEASAAKGAFMSRMSHEIRTPLNAIIGYNTIATNEMSEAKDDAERRQAEMKVMDCLGKSEIASRHLLTIINDVLDMSAIESGRVKLARDRFDFKGLITSLTTVFYSQANGKNVEFNVIFDTPTDEWFVGDQVRTNQILMNLLSNAIKFTPGGGSVALRIRQDDAPDEGADISFDVTDTGIGMSEEYLSHIWTPFEQADSSISRRFGGTGLGLSITKNLVDMMGGTISVKSQPEKGTSFSVVLHFGKTDHPLNTEAYDFSGINALIVDDDPSTCDYIRFLFTRCSVSCAAATSGADALKAVAAAKEKGHGYSLYIVDWRMPDMDGIETIRGIRSLEGSDIPIVVLTAYDYTEIAEKAAEVGITKFVAKPLFQSSLFDLLVSVSSAKPQQNAKDENVSDFAGARVLLVEDNAMNMEIAQKILEHSGFVVDAAWNGLEAVSAFDASASGTYDAILMDVHMPEMDGLEATRAIRSSGHPDAKTIPIIAMTADAFTENVAEAVAAGMNDHIAKPIDLQTLFDTLGRYVGKSDRR